MHSTASALDCNSPRLTQPPADSAKQVVPRSSQEMMDGVEPNQSFNDQIDRDDDIEKPRDNQNENAGDKRHDGREFSRGDDHDLPRSWNELAQDAGAERCQLTIQSTQTLNAVAAVRFLPWWSGLGT